MSQSDTSHFTAQDWFSRARYCYDRAMGMSREYNHDVRADLVAEAQAAASIGLLMTNLPKEG